ncbi:MAG TPA: TCP-1/cpn60 chaperonin family protein [Spirochaetia bacterium]|nr:TCP-1/cpn60 chaperonin family protein [Spirochaetia bacterium]
MSLKQQASGGAEVDEKLAALVNNAAAIRATASAVEGTLGPKGLDTMLVDRFGEVVITNDGVTILTMMEATHPAARMLINIARAQQEEVGDGTTTATVMAGTMVSQGLEHVVKGVPVSRVIEGMLAGLQEALAAMRARARTVDGLSDPRLARVALVAGREHSDIARLVADAARLTGLDKLRDPAFKFADIVLAEEGTESAVFSGVIIRKERITRQMPEVVTNTRVLVVDDALEPEDIGEAALRTEAGFARYMSLKEEFLQNLAKIRALGVGLVLVDRSIDESAEEFLTDAGIMAIQRVNSRELRRAAEHSGARMIKRTGLKKPPVELATYLGEAGRVFDDEKLGQVWIQDGKGKPMATVLVGAATAEVVGERERIARDAAAALQAAVKGGIVPGGGALELSCVPVVEKVRDGLRGMTAFGVDCVVEALKKPMSQIVANAGFNPLEKVGDCLAAQAVSGNEALGVDCGTGEITDMTVLGIFDPALVKIHALQAAGEIAQAILRIDTIIKMRDAKAAEDFTAR